MTHLHVVFVPLYRGLGCSEDLDLELHPLVLQSDRVVQHQHKVRGDLQWVLLKIQRLWRSASVKSVVLQLVVLHSTIAPISISKKVRGIYNRCCSINCDLVIQH
jgi:hypothetical protein